MKGLELELVEKIGDLTEKIVKMKEIGNDCDSMPLYKMLEEALHKYTKLRISQRGGSTGPV